MSTPELIAAWAAAITTVISSIASLIISVKTGKKVEGYNELHQVQIAGIHNVLETISYRVENPSPPRAELNQCQAKGPRS